MLNNPTFIEVYDDVLDRETCSKICKFIDTKKNAGVATYEKNKSKEFYSIIRPMVYGSFELYNELIVKVLRKYARIYSKKYHTVNHGVGNENDLEEHWKLQKSYAGAGFTAWHCEQGRLDYAQGRYLVWMIYLNDTIGGETEFQYQNYACSPKAGRLVIWPAAWTHPHRQRDNLESMKYIATGWWRYE